MCYASTTVLWQVPGAERIDEQMGPRQEVGWLDPGLEAALRQLLTQPT